MEVLIYGKKDDVIFRRFSLNSDGTVATYLDKMNLRNFGHCQTLDYYTWHGVSYFLMSCHYTTTNYVDNNGNPYYWATEICRVQYIYSVPKNSF